MKNWRDNKAQDFLKARERLIEGKIFTYYKKQLDKLDNEKKWLEERQVKISQKNKQLIAKNSSLVEEIDAVQTDKKGTLEIISYKCHKSKQQLDEVKRERKEIKKRLIEIKEECKKLEHEYNRNHRNKTKLYNSVRKIERHYILFKSKMEKKYNKFILSTLEFMGELKKSGHFTDGLLAFNTIRSLPRSIDFDKEENHDWESQIKLAKKGLDSVFYLRKNELKEELNIETALFNSFRNAVGKFYKEDISELEEIVSSLKDYSIAYLKYIIKEQDEVIEKYKKRLIELKSEKNVEAAKLEQINYLDSKNWNKLHEYIKILDEIRNDIKDVKLSHKVYLNKEAHQFYQDDRKELKQVLNGWDFELLKKFLEYRHKNWCVKSLDVAVENAEAKKEDNLEGLLATISLQAYSSLT